MRHSGYRQKDLFVSSCEFAIVLILRSTMASHSRSWNYNILHFFFVLLLCHSSKSLAFSSKPSEASSPIVALVTGANKGIGKEIAKAFLSAGITTILACRTNGKETAAELNSDYYCYLDLTDDESIDQCRAYVERTFGTLDILCNNAAICFTGNASCHG